MKVRELEIETSAGRRLEVLDCGEIGQPAVVVQHGTPGAATLFPEWLADAERRGIRLIGYSRPGYGGSTRAKGRNVSDAASDLARIADQLSLARLATWGYSGGGPHVLAAAAHLPGLVVAAAAIASPAPYGAEGLDFLAGMGEANVEEFAAVLEGEAAIRPLHEAAAATPAKTAEEVVESMASVLSPVDRAAIRDQLGDWLVSLLSRAVAAGADGWIDDDLAFVAPWGFELSQISVPLQLWQGQHDLMVPSSHGRWLAERLPQADAHFLSEAGHLTLLVNQVPLIHQWLLEHF